jgi:plasmid stabilization system protein ParE
MREVRWSRLAPRDLSAIEAYYADPAPDFVARAEDALLGAADFLLDAPNAGAPFGLSGARKWGVSGIPYVILYRPTDAGVLIVRIHHVRENWRMS